MAQKQVGKTPTTVNDAARFGDLRSPFRNRIINGNFAINQRAAASASTSYSAGTYIMDRWKAGSNGVTLSFATAANGDVTLTITAGSLVQVIEGTLYLPEGGSYILSWAGTATGRIYQGTAGAFVAGPVAATGLTAGTNTSVEFASGTLSLAQFEPGTFATVFERRDGELERALRYYFSLAASGNALFLLSPRVPTAEPHRVGYLPFPKPMRVAPTTLTLTAYDETLAANISCSSINPTPYGTGLFASGNTNGTVVNLKSVIASAEL